MLSAKGEIFDKVLGLELGADDYMIKPFDSKELVARVKAVLRRYQAGSSAVSSVPKQQGEFVEYPDLVVNLTNYSVLYKGRSVDMPAQGAGASLLPCVLSQPGLYQGAAPGPYLGV